MSRLLQPINFPQRDHNPMISSRDNVSRRLPFLFSRILPLFRRVSVRNIHPHESHIIGNREVVGFGWNGSPEYWDNALYPFPAIRWQETTPELCCLREKERGDWKKLTLEEKKALYRWSFRHTIAETVHPTGSWKCTIGCFLILSNLAVWYWYIFYHKLLYRHNPLPDTFSDEKRALQFRRILDMENNPILGLASQWDYEKDDWKPGYGPKK